jgi:hypothetical protein
VAASASVLDVILMRRGQQKGLEIRAWRRWGSLLLDRSTGHHRQIMVKMRAKKITSLAFLFWIYRDLTLLIYVHADLNGMIKVREQMGASHIIFVFGCVDAVSGTHTLDEHNAERTII